MPVEIDNRHGDLMSSSIWIKKNKLYGEREEKSKLHGISNRKNRLNIIYLLFASVV